MEVEVFVKYVETHSANVLVLKVLVATIIHSIKLSSLH